MERNDTVEEKKDIKKAVTKFFEETSPDEIKRLAQDMEKAMTYYRCAIREVETKFRVLDDQLSLGDKRNPIESIKTRLKSLKSIREKLMRKGFEISMKSIEDNLNDVAGIRVITGYIDDVYMLADCLIKQDDVTLIEKKDYIKNPKPNGYRSLHLIVEIPVFLCDEKKTIRVEVQLRTIAMESWANLEHSLYYKNDISGSEAYAVAEKLYECAKMSSELDKKMQEIKNLVEKP